METETRGAEGKYAKVLYVSEYPGSSYDIRMEGNRSDWLKLVEVDMIGSPMWSPDGGQLAFVEIDSVPDDNVVALYSTRIVSPNGSNLETVHQTVGGCRWARYRCPGGEVAWSPDGTKLLISGSRSISVVNADGSGLRTLAKLRDNHVRHLHPSWSPDGSMIIEKRQDAISLEIGANFS